MLSRVTGAVMEKENKALSLPTDEELFKIAEEAVEKYADALGELA